MEIGMSRYISINPKIQFGDPCVKGTRITVHNLADMNKGGDSVKLLCSLYNLKPAQVKAAIRFYKTYYHTK